MYIKTTLSIWVLLITFTISNAYFPKYCSECEEEIWEEVPCDEMVETTTPVPTTTPYTPHPPVTSTTTEITTTTPMPSTKISYIKSYPSQYTSQYTPRPSIYDGTSSSIPHYITSPPTVTPSPIYPSYPTTPIPESSNAYKKCYCECKLGCKEFCRKVVVNTDNKKQITQITKTLQNVPNGRIESKHLHQQKFLPLPYDSAPIYDKPYTYPNLLGLGTEPYSQYNQHRPYAVESSLELGNMYNSPKTVYSSIPIVSNYNKLANIDSSVYSIQELSKLLQSDHYDKYFNTNVVRTPVSHYNNEESIYNGYEMTDKVAKAAANSASASIKSIYSDNSNSNFIDKEPPYPSVHEIDLVIDRYLKEYANPDSISSSYSLSQSSLHMPY